MTATVFCVDFDETLSNTDRLRAGQLEAIRRIGGEDLETAYSEAYEAVRKEHGGIRMPLVLKKLAEQPSVSPDTHRQIAEMFHTFPYQDYIYSGVEQVIAHLKALGNVIIFSDGDAFYHPQKVYATAVARLVEGVILLPSKVDHFADLSGYWPADQYVFIDDKQKVLDAAKAYFGEQATTVLVRQGRYATSTEPSTADISVASIAEVTTLFPLK